jgi:hypothetical protein
MEPTKTRRDDNTRRWNEHLLPPRTPIPPDIPPRTPIYIQPLLPAQRADGRRREALVVAVVPLADVVGDLDLGVARRVRAVGLAVRGPGELGQVGDVEELEGSLGALAGGDVAVWGVSNVVFLGWFGMWGWMFCWMGRDGGNGCWTGQAGIPR